MNDQYLMTDLSETESYLSHHGIKGMKWGVRQYQNSDGSLTEEGRKRYGVGPERNSKTDVMKKAFSDSKAKMKKAFSEHKAKSAEKKAAKKAKTEAEAIAEKMKYLREHPTQLYKHRYELSENDVKELVSKIEFDRKLKDIRNAEIKRGWDVVNSFSNNAQSVYNLMNSAKNIYNLTADVHNSMIDAGKLNGTKMTKIGDSGKKLKKQNATGNP